MEENYLLLDSIDAAVSRHDIGLLLYIWTQSFRGGKKGIATREYISAAVPQLSADLGYSVTTFSDLVRRWYWNEIQYLFQNDFPSLVDLLRESPYRTPSDAFVEYYPQFSSKIGKAIINLYDLAHFIYYLCLKSSKKEGLAQALAKLINPVELSGEEGNTYFEREFVSSYPNRYLYDVLLQDLYELCEEEDNYDPLYVLFRSLLLIPENSIDHWFSQLVDAHHPPEAVSANVLREIFHSQIDMQEIVNFTLRLLLVPREKKLVLAMIRDETSDELLYELVNRADGFVNIGVERYPERKKYAIIRQYFANVVLNERTKRKLKLILNGESSFRWFEQSFRFQRKKYVMYFGNDDALLRVEQE